MPAASASQPALGLPVMEPTLETLSKIGKGNYRLKTSCGCQHENEVEAFQLVYTLVV